MSNGNRRIVHGATLVALVTIGWLHTPARADFVVAYTGATEVAPAIVYNSVEDEHLAAWIDTNGGVGPTVKIQRLDPVTGALLGAAIPVLEPTLIPYAPYWRPVLGYSPVTNTYVIGVNVSYGPSLYENMLIIGSFDGATLAETERYGMFIGSDFQDDFPDGSKIELTYNELDDEFMVAYLRKLSVPPQIHYVITTQRYEVGTGPIGTETDLINAGVNGIGAIALGYSTFIAQINPLVLGSTFLLASHGGYSDELNLFLVDPSATVYLGIPFTSSHGAYASAPSIATGRLPGMTHDYWLVTWNDRDNVCGSGGKQYIAGCAEGTPWRGIYGSFFDPWRFVYGPAPDNIVFPISMFPRYSLFEGVDVAYNPQDEAFHVVWRAVGIDDPENDESRSHIRMNTVDTWITAYPAPQPYPNYVVSDITGSCPPAPMACESDQAPVMPAIAANAGTGGTVVWEQKYPPNPVDHDILGDLVTPVPEPGGLAMLAAGVMFLGAVGRRRAVGRDETFGPGRSASTSTRRSRSRCS